LVKSEYKIKTNVKQIKAIVMLCSSLEIEIRQVLEAFPIAKTGNEAASLFFLNTESSWLSLLTLAIRRINKKASFLEELTIYNDKHVGRLDLLISVPKQNVGYEYYLVEAKCREWKGGYNWSTQKVNEKFKNIYTQAFGYAEQIVQKSFSHFKPEIVSISFDWIRKGSLDSNSRINEARSYFNNFEIESTGVDFLLFYHTETDGLLIYGKIGTPY